MSTLVVQSTPPGMSMELELPEKIQFTKQDFEELCARNRDLNAELTSEGDLIIMTPTGGNSGWRNSEISTDLANWTRRTQSGIAFDSSTLFELPNGALRGPDASWVSRERWEALTDAERDGFPPLCPEFVLKLRSKTDRLTKVHDKMEEYMENGALLGYLIDPVAGEAHVYRPGNEPEILTKPESLAGGPEFPGLVINLQRIW